MLNSVFAILCCKRPRSPGLRRPPFLPEQPIQSSHVSSIPTYYLLTEAEKRAVEQAWSNSDTSMVLREYDGIRLNVHSLRTLQPGNWVNDEVINCYATLLSRHNSDLIIHNTYFYTLLKLKKTHQTIDLTEIDRIYRRRGVRAT